MPPTAELEVVANIWRRARTVVRPGRCRQTARQSRSRTRQMTTQPKRRSMPVMPALTLAIALSTILGGCQHYLDESTARTVGEFTDDATIQLIVKKRLVGARDVRGMRINVEVNKGVVTLIGKVRSEEERNRALEIVAEVPNVVKVVDELEIP